MRSRKDSVQTTQDLRTVIAPTEAELIAELAALWEEDEKREGEIGIGDMMAATGKPRGAVRDFLEAQVRSGRLIKRTTSSGRVWFRAA